MSSKLPNRPNLALAGKREASAPKPNSSAKRGGTVGRGRGRGRGGAQDSRGPAKRQELIQTGGVFSEGLGGDFPSRRKERDADTQQFSYKKSGIAQPKNDLSKSNLSKEEREEISKKLTDGKTSFKGWEEIWESDEDLDDQQLNSLRPKGILSSYKKGKFMPFVLPQEDKPQFRSVIDSNTPNYDDSDEELKDVNPDLKGGIRKKKPTASEMISILEGSADNLIHLQLPSVIGSLCHFMKNQKIEENNGQNAMEVDDEPNRDLASCSDQILQPGQKIGKLQVTKKGNVLLKIGGHTINITSRTTSGRQQGTVLLETETFEQNTDQFGMSGSNALYYMGNVKHNLVGSMSWSQLNEHRKQLDEIEEKKEKSVKDVKRPNELLELEAAQKSWMQIADKWASGRT
ncbi:unnamed protein product [Caenorhabditis bovis]|uniref:DNA-directed RNA polymerase III subunit RPC4 n=1 Tax=Caenorhabditis bovis TaxID=2654633 RepID=A0A8S1F5F6_9PELO|nr:unnamed protein product [Caenorhabditis bovis]